MRVVKRVDDGDTELDPLMTTLLLSMNRILVPINMFVVIAAIKNVE